MKACVGSILSVERKIIIYDIKKTKVVNACFASDLSEKVNGNKILDTINI